MLWSELHSKKTVNPGSGQKSQPPSDAVFIELGPGGNGSVGVREAGLQLSPSESFSGHSCEVDGGFEKQ